MNFANHYSHIYLNSISIMHRKAFKMPRKKLLFIDRDGVLIEDVHHINSKDKVVLLTNVIPFLKYARDLNYDICVVTNQSSLSRSIINIEQYIEISQEFLSKLTPDLYPDFILSSFHLPNSKKSGYNWRKPDLGMFRFMIDNLSYSPNQCIMFGDKLSDLIPAYKIGISKLNYIESPLHKEELEKITQWHLTINKSVNLIFSNQLNEHLLDQ